MTRPCCLQLVRGHQRSLARTALQDQLATFERQCFRVEGRERIEQRAMDSLDRVLVNFADVDEQDFAGFEPCACLLYTSDAADE